MEIMMTIALQLRCCGMYMASRVAGLIQGGKFLSLSGVKTLMVLPYREGRFCVHIIMHFA